jgi:hypothetical protein
MSSVFCLLSSVRAASHSIMYGRFDLAKPRDVSNDMPDRRYLAWRFTGPAAAAKQVSFTTTNPMISPDTCGRGSYDGQLVCLPPWFFVIP